MDSVKTLIVGAGMSGLAAAAFSKARGDCLVLERDAEMGGYCKTVKKAGFVWDYSGHFFHFKHPEIEAFLRQRMAGQNIRTVNKRSFISYGGKWIDFPFQKNIHQLPQDEFIDCLYDLYFARTGSTPLPETNFKEMLHARFGRSIAEKFLIPYNEKLYATDLARLDKDAMGRFFPHADLTDIIRNMKAGTDTSSYNATFTYPEGGAIEYVKAIASELDPKQISLNEKLLSVELAGKVAKTTRRELRYERLISSMPFNRLLQIAQVKHDPSVFTWNQVLVFNLGFDRKAARDVHWLYFPARACSFYRVGYYDNIFDTDRLSLYVELGFPAGAAIDVPAMRERVLRDLKTQGVTTDHQLVAEHSVVMDPAYVHITQQSMAMQASLRKELAAQGVYSIGRYGGWTYCSIEDNIVEARALVQTLS
ncbi:MAG: protoporphyrinogen/coproporphyrinogen oxidase [Myxococcaceae bacterium]